MQEPLKYNIHFRIVNDFRSFANMICRFSVAGYVEEGAFHENMFDLLEIMSHCPLNCLTLVLTKYKKEDIPEIGRFLQEAGLLNDVNMDSVA